MKEKSLITFSSASCFPNSDIRFFDIRSSVVFPEFGFVAGIGLPSPVNLFLTASSEEQKLLITVNILLICWSSGKV